MRNSDAFKSIVQVGHQLGGGYPARRLILLATLLWAHSAVAATYTVTTLGDAAGTCAGVNPNFSCTTLRAAIDEANVTTGVADTIVFSASGTITLDSALPDVTDTLTINGGNAVTIAGGNFGSLIFDGAEASNSQLLNMRFTGTSEPASTLRVQNTTDVLIQGNTFTMGVTTGSAILVRNSDNVTTNSNTVTGGVYSINYYNDAGSPYLTDPAYNGTITNNNVTSGSSGIAIYTANNILVNGNTITGSTGIGIRLGMQFDAPYGSNNNTITNNIITNGRSAGISVTGYGGGVQMGVFNNNLIQGNTITGNSGAGVLLPSTSLIQTNGNVITGNTITGNGGDGVNITGANAADNIIYANTNISGNGGLGIDLAANGVTANDAGDTDTGPNGVQNFPVTVSVSGTTVNFLLDTTANANGYRIDFYNNTGGLDPTGYGEGQVWLGSCIVASPSATVPSSCSIAGVDAATLRMTATRCLTAACNSGATSEFNGPSANLTITKTNTPGVNGEMDQANDTVTGGLPTTYTLVVSNAGPGSANNSVAKDTPDLGLSDCVATCTSTTGGAVCPATPANLLTTGGVTIATFPANSSLTFNVTCNVP